MHIHAELLRAHPGAGHFRCNRLRDLPVNGLFGVIRALIGAVASAESNAPIWNVSYQHLAGMAVDTDLGEPVVHPRPTTKSPGLFQLAEKVPAP